MSPKSLVFLLLVGLCAAQMASADSPPTQLARLRHERGVKELLAAAKVKLENILALAKDAASASVEAVWDYVYDLEAQVLNAGTEQLFAQGIEVNLTTISAMVKSNIKNCLTDEEIIEKSKAVLHELVECVSNDAESLKKLIKNMQNLWATAQTLPATMAQVADQCSAHIEEDEIDVLEDFDGDEETHDLATKANELLAEASKTMSKRELWGFGRMMRCCKSVYTLSKSDLVTIPGQIIAASANGYRVYQAAQGGIQSCVSLKASKNMPVIASLSLDLSMCISKMDIDELIVKYPSLSGLKQLVALSEKLKNFQTDPMGSAKSLASSALAGNDVMPGVALPAAARQALNAAGGVNGILG